MKRNRRAGSMSRTLTLASLVLALSVGACATLIADSTVGRLGQGLTFVAGFPTAQGGSGQGGYLGINPGAHQTSSAGRVERVGPSRTPGSGQGGYLGLGAGENLKPLVMPTEADYPTSPMAWCTAESPDPGRCRAKAGFEHPYCMTRPEHYRSCRRALDSMHN